jgi:hypothetical protein
MFRTSLRLVGFVLVVGIAANLNAGFIENWDTEGYSDEDPLKSPWVDAQSTSSTLPTVARDMSSMALSGSNCVTHMGGTFDESAASRPTYVGLSDTNVQAIASFRSEVGGLWDDCLFALSPSATAGDDRWRSIPGSLALMWTPAYGVDTYYCDGTGTTTIVHSTAARDGVGTDYVQFRMSMPYASGAQTATVDWRQLSSGTWTSWSPVGTIGLDDRFRATNFGMMFYCTLWGDDMSVSSVPEPSSLVMMAGGLVGLLAYAWRKQK